MNIFEYVDIAVIMPVSIEYLGIHHKLEVKRKKISETFRNGKQLPVRQKSVPRSLLCRNH